MWLRARRRSGGLAAAEKATEQANEARAQAAADRDAAARQLRSERRLIRDFLADSRDTDYIAKSIEHSLRAGR